MLGGGGEVDGKYESNGAVTGDDVKGSGSDGATLRDQELGSDGGNDEGFGGVLPLGGLEDIRDVSSASRGGGMVAEICGRGLGCSGDVAN